MTLGEKIITWLKRPKTIVALILTVLVLILVVQNTGTINTRFLWIHVSMPHALLMLFTFLVGFAVGALATAWRRHSKHG